MILSCNGQGKYLDKQTVLNIYEKKYDSLRQNLRDSLAQGIRSVNDFNTLYTPDERKKLDSIISNFKTSSGLQIAIITYDSSMLSADSIEDVTSIIAIKNQINTTIGISIPYRIMHIWNDSLVNNTMLPQHETKYIIDHNFIPDFKNGQYFQGTLEGLKAIMHTIEVNAKAGKGIKKKDGS